MRKIIVSEFLTLDGVMEAPDKWVFPYWNEEIGKVKFDELFASDTLLLGRLTYQIFADAWPSLTDEEDWRRVKEAGGQAGEIPKGNPFADRMNSIAKLIVSTTLNKVEWNNSSLIKGSVAEELSRLKQMPGQDILVAGSSQLVNTLMQHNLIDEYRLLVYPIILGSGKRLFQEGSKIMLNLIETRSFGTGVVLLRYQPEGKGG
jgi:dihydrofolate reductase